MWRGIDLDSFIRNWRSAFGEQLTRRQAIIPARREAQLYADLKRPTIKPKKASKR
jgi:hypothetical protein